MTLCDKWILLRLGEVSKKCCLASVSLLCDKSITWREGRRKQSSAIVWMLLWERLRYRRDGKSVNTNEWRKWSWLLLKSRWRREEKGAESSIDLATDLIWFPWRLRSSKLGNFSRKMRSTYEMLLYWRINSWKGMWSVKTLGDGVGIWMYWDLKLGKVGSTRKWVNARIVA